MMTHFRLAEQCSHQFYFLSKLPQKKEKKKNTSIIKKLTGPAFNTSYIRRKFEKRDASRERPKAGKYRKRRGTLLSFPSFSLSFSIYADKTRPISPKLRSGSLWPFAFHTRHGRNGGRALIVNYFAVKLALRSAIYRRPRGTFRGK